MSQKQMAFKPDGTPTKRAGWFSWRHATNEAHIAANVGRSRAESLARKRREAADRDAALAANSPRRRRNRLEVAS